MYALRWRVPLGEILSEVYCGTLLTSDSEMEAGAARVQAVGDLLDAFIPPDLQWNFWYRPSVCNPLSPMCRLGWKRDCFLEFEAELRTLVGLYVQLDASEAGQARVLKLFKPATMYMRREEGFATTHIYCEQKPLRERPSLEFAAEDYAPYAPVPPYGAGVHRFLNK